MSDPSGATNGDWDREDELLDQYVIYWNPSDYPDQFVVRRWMIAPGRFWPTDEAQAFDMLEEARMAVPEGRTLIPRFDADDPAIVEVWTW